jgi:hypothetical protein
MGADRDGQGVEAVSGELVPAGIAIFYLAGRD